MVPENVHTLSTERIGHAWGWDGSQGQKHRTQNNGQQFACGKLSLWFACNELHPGLPVASFDSGLLVVSFYLLVTACYNLSPFCHHHFALYKILLWPSVIIMANKPSKIYHSQSRHELLNQLKWTSGLLRWLTAVKIVNHYVSHVFYWTDHPQKCTINGLTNHHNIPS